MYAAAATWTRRNFKWKNVLYAQLNPGPNIVLIGRQILIGRFFFKFVNGTNGFFKINIYI